MIVISGALVLVALVLLVLGLTMQDLNFVYGSIAVSLVSFVFLVIGILQRRGEQPAPAAAGPEVRDDAAPAPAASEDPAPTAPVAVPAARSRRAPVAVVEAEPEPEPELDEEVESGGAVLVVPGRPRYHVEGCRYLTGKQAEQVDVLDARADGFTACGVCKPDLALVEEPGDIFPADFADEPVVDTGVPGAEDDELLEQAVAPARGRGSRRVGEAAPTRTGPTRTAAKKAPAKKAPARKAAAPAAAVVDAAPKKAARAGKVVVIPDRGRFHTADCRFVRGVEGTEELTRTQATRQGFQPCGVCKPA